MEKDGKLTEVNLLAKITKQQEEARNKSLVLFGAHVAVAAAIVVGIAEVQNSN